MGEQGVATLEAIASLIRAVGSPAIAIFVLVFFGAPIRSFLGDLGELTVSLAGGSVVVKRRQLEAAAFMGAALAQQAGGGGEPNAATVASIANAASNVVSRIGDARRIPRLSDARVLWVDDRPANNVYERQALEALGVRFVLSECTEDALQKLRTSAFDLVITDMGRPPDARAGYTLLNAARNQGNRTPFIIYASSRLPEHREESRQHGAIDCTNSPQELFEMVIEAIQSRADARR